MSIIAGMVIWRRGPLAWVSLRGRKATGQVVRIARDDASKVRLRIKFPDVNGREIEYLEPVSVKARVGESLNVRYSARNTECATAGRPQNLAAEILVFGIVFGIAGMAVFVGALAGLIGTDHRLFYGVSGTGFFALIGCILVYVAVQSYGKVRSSRRRAVADGTVKRVMAMGSGKEYPHPWIAYKTLDGRDIEYWDTALTGYGPGEKIAVYYDPEYPEFTSTATDKSGHAGQAAFYGVAGLLCIGACGWSAWSYLIN
jgi:hypothetical protein